MTFSSPAIRGAFLRDIVEPLFYEEADLLDERRYEEWLDLLTEDFLYFMPLRRNVEFGAHEALENTRQGRDVSWFDENKETLTKRVQQIMTGTHWAEEPFSRVTHMATNIRFAAVQESQVVVTSRFLVYRNRVEAESSTLVGRRIDRLREVDGEWKFCGREVLLDQSVLLVKNLTLFV